MDNRKGFLLVGVLLIFLLLIIIVPVMVKWVQEDTKMSVKDQKTSIAFSLAEAALDRGYWKAKSSTTTFADISDGNLLTGYKFDTEYKDIPGGSYRIMITSGPDIDQITIWGEGRDILNRETRALKTVYTNTSVPGAILSGNNLNADEGSEVHWGPIMAKGDITLTGAAITTYFPRKLAMGTVHPRDTNGTETPNYSLPREQSDWESNYNVPELPVFDFDTMRASAAATGTLNCQDVSVAGTKTCSGSNCISGTNCSCSGFGWYRTCTGNGCVDPGSNCTCTIPTTITMKCSTSTVFGGSCPLSAGVPNCTVSDLFLQTDASGNKLRDKDYTWFWDGNVTWKGYTGTKGTIVALGDMSILKIPSTAYDDRYCKNGISDSYSDPGCTVPVPPNAWREYQNTHVTDYPAKKTSTSNYLTYKIGSNDTGSGGDLGVYGFLYVGGDFLREGAADIYGAMWVAGAVYGSGNTMVFYNAKLKIPTLNVVLKQESWQETSPSLQSW